MLCSALLAVSSVVSSGYQARTRSAKALGTRDLNVALVEDIVAIAGSLWVVSRF